MGISFSQMIDIMNEKGYTNTFYFEDGWNNPNNFFKQFISGALIAIVMTGLDQDMMQKNITCRTIKDAQKNVFTFSIILVFANILFLTLGALLYIFAASKGIEVPERTDQLFPLIALNHLTPTVGILFILGLIAAAYSSADSALTSLTTSFCVDFLGMNKEEDNADLDAVLKSGVKNNTKTRFLVHIGWSIILLLIILAFNAYNDDSVINKIFVAATYTYGPILGLFSFAILTNRNTRSAMILPICIASPVLCYFINSFSPQLFGGFTWGYLILALNGFLTFIGLYAFSNLRPDGQ
jgi:Na+/proline symporter